ncbi:hypothetical protein K1719_006932 [Acacia pycnantha]|nr:hypothetical protein K1719_006932 [Acacia pycnantha]
MGMISKCSPIPSLLLVTASLLLLLHLISAAENTNLVYKGCAEQKLEDPSGIYSQNLQALMTSLVGQSGQKPFSSTTSGDNQNAIMGLYQCRGDLTNSDCYNCVSKIPNLLDKLCGKVAAARVQLVGCNMRYEIVGFKQIPETQLLYRVCGKKVKGSELEERRETAFGMVVSGVKTGGNLFYTGSYQSLYVLGQCQGDLDGADCGDCVKSAEDQAKVQCRNSISAQIYLHRCYVSYSFYPNGVPRISSSSSSSSGTGQQHTQKTVALAVGGFAAVGFLIACLLFFKSVFKKRSNKY